MSNRCSSFPYEHRPILVQVRQGMQVTANPTPGPAKSEDPRHKNTHNTEPPAPAPAPAAPDVRSGPLLSLSPLSLPSSLLGAPLLQVKQPAQLHGWLVERRALLVDARRHGLLQRHVLVARPRAHQHEERVVPGFCACCVGYGWRGSIRDKTIQRLQFMFGLAWPEALRVYAHTPPRPGQPAHICMDGL